MGLTGGEGGRHIWPGEGLTPVTVDNWDLDRGLTNTAGPFPTPARVGELEEAEVGGLGTNRVATPG